jgi:hypothetical protein
MSPYTLAASIPYCTKAASTVVYREPATFADMGVPPGSFKQARSWAACRDRLLLQLC